MDAPHVEHKTLSSFDGTSIAYQVRGQGPAVVLANGLGGTYTTWRHQYALFGDDYKLISWDYRGLFRSGRPPDLTTVSLAQQVRDLEAILAHEKVDRALFLGWSMGVQYNFEYYRDHSDQFVGLVVLNGVPGRPFATAFGSTLMRCLIPVGVALMKQGAPIMSVGTRFAAHSAFLIPVLQSLGMVARTLDTQVFTDLTREYSTMDFEAYAETLRLLGDHDASDVVPKVQVPALIVTGTRDFFTPMATAEGMARDMPDAELVSVKGGTHYAAVEFPAEVNGHIRRFVRKLKYGPMP